jgi:hypothetical protein
MEHLILLSLEERKKIMTEFQSEMKHVISLVEHYHKEVKYILDNKISSSAISHLTFSLTSHLVKTVQNAEVYKKMVTLYLLDDCYDENHELLMRFKDVSEECLRVMVNIRELNVFSFDDDEKNDVTQNRFFIEGFCNDSSLLYELRKEIDLSQLNGMQLLNVLYTAISAIANLLIDIKNNSIYFSIGEFEQIFQANYRLFENCYWPNLYNSFLSLHNYPFKDITVKSLKEILDEEIRQFTATQVGQLWRNYGNNDGEFAQKLKNMNLSDDQWHFVFSNLMRFNEYKKWIYKLENPPESDEDKQKRERLLKSNKVFNLKPSKSKYRVDILLLYFFIKDRFIPERMFVYEWYALYYILKRVGVITTCTIEEFEKQMNDEEWFPNVEKKCSANEINNYGFLTEKSPDIWDVKFKPTGNRASKKSIENLSRKYLELEDTLDEIYIKE